MYNIEPDGVISCGIACASFCLVCISDGPMIIVDIISGATGLQIGSTNT